MDKQIEEMAKVIARRSKDFRNPNVAFMTTARKTAESLYKQGYRKASDVAREIFGHIESFFHEDDFGDLTIDFMVFQELKKKYVSEGG